MGIIFDEDLSCDHSFKLAMFTITSVTSFVAGFVLLVGSLNLDPPWADPKACVPASGFAFCTAALSFMWAYHIHAVARRDRLTRLKWHETVVNRLQEKMMKAHETAQRKIAGRIKEEDIVARAAALYRSSSIEKEYGGDEDSDFLSKRNVGMEEEEKEEEEEETRPAAATGIARNKTVPM